MYSRKVQPDNSILSALSKFLPSKVVSFSVSVFFIHFKLPPLSISGNLLVGRLYFVASVSFHCTYLGLYLTVRIDLLHQNPLFSFASL